MEQTLQIVYNAKKILHLLIMHHLIYVFANLVITMIQIKIHASSAIICVKNA